MTVQFFPLKTAVEAFDLTVIRRFAFSGKGLADIILPQQILEGIRRVLLTLIAVKNEGPVRRPGADRFTEALGQHLGRCFLSDLRCHDHPGAEIDDDADTVLDPADTEEGKIAAPDLIGKVAGKKFPNIDFAREILGLCQINLFGAVPDAAESELLHQFSDHVLTNTKSFFDKQCADFSDAGNLTVFLINRFNFLL